MGRTALVVGGSSGIGLATAAALVQSGHRVVVGGRDPGALDEASDKLAADGSAAVSRVVVDLADPESARGVVPAVEQAVGPVDVLVLGGGGPPPGTVLQVSDDDWARATQLLLVGPLQIARAALPGMASRGFGRVVFLTSTAVRQPQPALAASVVLRSAVTAAAKLLSREYAAEGVTVNCVAPGATDTDRRRTILADRAARSGSSVSAEDGADVAVVPIGRPARPQEVAAGVAFLASSEAAYVNGTVLTVDGGRTEAP